MTQIIMMELHKLVSLIILFISVIHKTSAQFEFQYKLCGDSYTTPSTYQKNLNTTLNSMSTDTRITYGYYNFTAGKKPDKVEAMALCRSDISVHDCRLCVRSSAATIITVCPDVKQAFGYSDSCWVYYTNHTAFHYLTDEPFWTLLFNGNVTNMPNFNTSLTTLLTNLTHQASLGNSQIKFATGKTSVTSNQSLYGLVQCSPDLSRRNCSACLHYLISNTLTSTFVTFTKRSLFMAKGGRVVSPSCFFRYELYSFYGNVTYKAQAPAQPPGLAPSPSTRNSTSAQAVKSGKSHKTVIIVAPIVGSLVLIFIVAAICILLRKRKQKKITEKFNKEEMEALQSLQFSIATIKAATENFADDHKLGEGAFGTVYKGTLPDGQEVAVKRLKADAVLGHAQFKNEILTLAKLHHRNLVRLLGFCVEDGEMLLIYEFVINKSLDYYVFDPVHRASTMQWETRYKIINGIARGLLYLHEDSRLRIIHRDLKAANVLLDGDFNPKIADFGTARLFKIDQTQTHTSNVVGTHGYIPPEYWIQGQVSLKSDVFSFGVLVLEIVSGQRTNSFQVGETKENMLTFAWKKWLEGNTWSIVDPSLSPNSKAEIQRCIHIGLLCVQNNMVDRPTMSSVSLMLSSYSMTLEVPSQPAFFSQAPVLVNVLSQGDTSEQTNSKSYSVNDVTLTDLHPR